MSQAVRVLLNGEPRALADISPQTAALEWLRRREGLCGAKDGCGEGDCGACTIVIGEAEDGGIRYRAVNACLVPLGGLDGKLVLTVEGLADGERLHPVQRALVETDSSQCGFCTPGIAMALFAFAKGGEAATDAAVHEALAGNLCRCTGYRPIVDAARRAAAAGAGDGQTAELAAALAALARPEGATFGEGDSRFFAPVTVAEVTALRALHPDARILAGGTDLVPMAAVPPRPVIALDRVRELKRVEQADDGLIVGAAVTLAEALPALEGPYPALGALIRRFGSRQIRNVATLCGNVATASPVGDVPPCLIALGATILLRGADGRRRIPASEFFTGYRETALAAGEIIEAVSIPAPASGEQFRAYKVSKRFDEDIATVSAAFRLRLVGGDVAEIRIAYGGMAERPRRATACERALSGRPWSEASVNVAAAALAGDFSPIGDHRGGAAYRATVAANLLRRFHAQTVAPDGIAELAQL